jgi:hypothetical protein
MRTSYFLLFILLTACASEPEPPKNLIPEEKMALIMADIHLLESKVKGIRISSDSAEAVFNHLEQKIFEKHNVERSAYVTSIKFYTDHPDRLHDIYQVVVDSLMVRQKQKRFN